MPLQDIPANLRVNDPGSRPRRKNLSTDAKSVASGPIPPPLAVQHMLRTTTETGNIQPLIPRLDSRLQPIPPRATSFASSASSNPPQSYHTQNPPERQRYRQPRPTSGLARYDTIQSSLSSYAYGPRTRRPGQRSHRSRINGMEFLDPRLSKPPLHHHRSLLTLRSFEDSMSGHPNSPSQLSTGSGSVAGPIRRSTYRPNNAFRHKGIIANGRNVPASLQSLSTSNTRYRHVPLQNPRPSLISPSISQLSLPASENDLHARRLTHAISRRRTPDSVWRHPGVPHRSFGNVFSGVNSQLHNANDNPRYYDYSESFVEEECFSPDRRAVSSIQSHNLDQIVMGQHSDALFQRAQTPFGTRLGSIFLPAELPTIYNRRNSDVSHSDIPIDAAAAVPNEPLRRFSPELFELPSDNENGSPKATQRRGQHLVTVRSCSPAASHRNRTSSSSGIFFTSGDRSQRDLATLAARMHSSSAKTKPRDPPSVTRVESITHSLTTSTLGAIKIHPSINRCLPFLKSGQSRPMTSPSDSDKRSIEILSPRPERPVSSQSRKQFSKIIDIDDTHAGTESCSDDFRQEPKDLRNMEPTGADQVLAVSMNSPELGNRAKWGKELLLTTIVDENLTPQQRIHLSLATSNGKSTVESLLDRHIQCLGLLPEPDTCSETSQLTEQERLVFEHNNENDLETASLPAVISPDLQSRLSVNVRKRATSLGSNSCEDLKPHRLFQSLKRNAVLELTDGLTSLGALSSPLPNGRSQLSSGWQTLPSTSHVVAQIDSSEPTVASGALADVDTDMYPLGKRVWRLSQFSLPTSFEERMTFSSSVKNEVVHHHRRSKSDGILRRESRRRRHIKVRLRQQNQVHYTNISSSRQNVSLPNSPDLNRRPPPNRTEYAELQGDLPISRTIRSDDVTRPPAESQIPSRWSSIMAAMPMPPTGKPKISRKVSTRTHHSQRSYQSQKSLVEPLNSTRQRAQLQILGGKVPRLAPPDLGPPLDTSTLNLSIPYAEAPSTIYPSIVEPLAYGAESQSRPPKPVHGDRRQFGLRPPKPAVLRPKVISGPLVTNLPTRNGYVIPAVGPYVPYSVDKSSLNTSSSSDFRQHRGLLDKFKTWWRCRCTSKAHRVRKQQREELMPSRFSL